MSSKALILKWRALLPYAEFGPNDHGEQGSTDRQVRRPTSPTWFKISQFLFGPGPVELLGLGPVGIGPWIHDWENASILDLSSSRV